MDVIYNEMYLVNFNFIKDLNRIKILYFLILYFLHLQKVNQIYWYVWQLGGVVIPVLAREDKYQTSDDWWDQITVKIVDSLLIWQHISNKQRNGWCFKRQFL